MSDSEAFEFVIELPAAPGAIYEAWIDAEKHAAMTGGAATSDPRPGGAFSAWDGYIEGRHIELTPAERIVQAWRTSQFPEGSDDSRVEILLEPLADGTATRLTLRHTDIPPGQDADYKSGWEEFYFAPMRSYFTS